MNSLVHRERIIICYWLFI